MKNQAFILLCPVTTLFLKEKVVTQAFVIQQLRYFFTYSSSFNLAPAISQVMIVQHLMFCSPTRPTCCNSPRKCTTAKYKAGQKAGFPVITYTTS